MFRTFRKNEKQAGREGVGDRSHKHIFFNMRAKYLYKLITHFYFMKYLLIFCFWINDDLPAKLFIHYLSIDLRGMQNMIRRQTHTHTPALIHANSIVFVLFLFAAFFYQLLVFARKRGTTATQPHSVDVIFTFRQTKRKKIVI